MSTGWPRPLRDPGGDGAGAGSEIHRIAALSTTYRPSSGRYDCRSGRVSIPMPDRYPKSESYPSGDLVRYDGHVVVTVSFELFEQFSARLRPKRRQPHVSGSVPGANGGSPFCIRGTVPPPVQGSARTDTESLRGANPERSPTSNTPDPHEEQTELVRGLDGFQLGPHHVRKRPSV